MKRVVQFLLMLTLLLATGCGVSTTSQGDQPPTLAIRQPDGAATALVGEEVRVVGFATDDVGVIRVELWADGQLASQVPAPSNSGLTRFSAAFVWIPTAAGDHVLQLKALDTAQSTTTSSDILVTVTGGNSVPTPLPQPTTAVTPTATALAPTATVAAGVPTATPGEIPSVTADDIVNVRSGPGITFDKLGTLDSGETVRVFGRNADSTWWQVAFADATEGKGWVFGELVTANDAAKTVEVVAAPAAPTSPPVPTATNTPLPTATPQSSIFRVDRTTINAGECTTLHWDVDGVQAVYLGTEGVSGHDTRSVCPAATTTYTLRVVRTAGEQSYTVTVNVQGAAGGCNGEPQVLYALGTTNDTPHVNQSFSLLWRVRNVREVWLIADDERIPVEGEGTFEDGLATHEFSYSAEGAHTYKLELKKCDDSSTIINVLTLTVQP